MDIPSRWYRRILAYRCRCSRNTNEPFSHGSGFGKADTTIVRVPRRMNKFKVVVEHDNIISTLIQGCKAKQQRKFYQKKACESLASAMPPRVLSVCPFRETKIPEALTCR